LVPSPGKYANRETKTMPRKIQDVQLPTSHSRPSSRSSRSRRAPSGQSNGAGLKGGVPRRAECPNHSNCAFTGREPGRCPICHSNHTFDDHPLYPPGRARPCLCTQCGELFSGPSAFGTHQVLRPEERGGGVICRDPEQRGLVLVDKNGWNMWAAPGERPEEINA
jgi:hypothetical protein